ncbi:flagellar biosynthesis protein [Tropicimonas sp. IMCC34043]|uniref:FliH/SctL family protein n=1 Tax=Tropicimonas sp. IMCC34043 TaxID=2248760 RepID=UPI000E272C06|nr:flagellar biosynthesis protein [Tropicimonas sp. IMCC34043]
MGRPLKLESFDIAVPATCEVAILPEEQLEEVRLQAFDQGYRAGWEDSASAFKEDQRRISEEFGNNLQELSFTYHEARNAVLAEMEGILRGMVDRVLPATLTRSLGEMILRQIGEAAERASEVPVDVVVSPANVSVVRSLIEHRVVPPLRIHGEQTLGDGQAFLRMGGSEHKFDLEAVLREIADAVTDFFEEPTTEEVSHA